MPAPQKSKSVREFCGTCGWPLEGGPRCDVCGGDPAPLPLVDAGRRSALREPPGGDDGAVQAFDAWRARDYARLIGLSLVAEGGRGPKTTTLAEGPVWSFFLRATPVFVAVQSAAGTLTIEAPLARLPQRQRVAAMRVALELCDRALLVSRVCLRGDLLLVRFVGRLGVVTPPTLRQAIRDVATLAERYGEMLETSFDARPAIAADARGAISWELIGRARMLTRLAPPASRSMPPPEMAGEEVPDSALESIPAVLAPELAAGGGAAPPGAPAPRLPARGGRATLHDLQVEAAPRRPTMPPPPMPVEGATPEERFCDLLRHTQALATALSYDEKPATMLLLVRSAVFRAVHEYGESVPDAVALLFRSCDASLEQIWQSASSTMALRKSATQIRRAEPALLAMHQIVAQRALVPKQAPLAVDPLTTAAEAKAHMARFADEIGHAPEQPQLRHFLALGALAELLVRTKLPQATDQRLREIVAHAHRDTGLNSSLELMMKALARIAAP